MNSGPTSNDPLSHFDRPKTLELPDFEWDEDVIPFDSTAGASRDVAPLDRVTEGFIEVPRDTRHGIGWVLAWASALAVLMVAAGVLADFAYLLAAERALSVAARAGTMEATLPRATYQSVISAVERRLNQYPSLARQLRLTVLQNGTLVQSHFRQHDGDRFVIALSGPTSAAIPDWLRTLMFWHGESEIRAHAERQIPGRTFAYGSSLATLPK